MYDLGTPSSRIGTVDPLGNSHQLATPIGFAVAKRGFDISFCLLLLPFLCALGVVLFGVSQVNNTGPVLFRQPRMGRNCQPFMVFKFRTMTLSDDVRSADDPLEHERITSLGAALRRSRVDELPQIINVLRGEMSLIGPRPDCYHHAVAFLQMVPGYAARHAVLPGISGYAQTELGYVEGIEATKQKVAADLHYITNRSLRLEAWIFWRTLVTVASRSGR